MASVQKDRKNGQALRHWLCYPVIEAPVELRRFAARRDATVLAAQANHH
jgi:hypothetical protein